MSKVGKGARPQFHRSEDGEWRKCRAVHYCWYGEHSEEPPPPLAARRSRREELGAMSPGERRADRAAYMRAYRAWKKACRQAQEEATPEEWAEAGKLAPLINGLPEEEWRRLEQARLTAHYLGQVRSAEALRQEELLARAAREGARRAGFKPKRGLWERLKRVLSLAILRSGRELPASPQRSGSEAPHLWEGARTSWRWFAWLFKTYDGLLERLLRA